MQIKETNDTVCYPDGKPMTGICGMESSETGDLENEMSDMWERVGITGRLQKLSGCGSRTGTGREDKKHGQHIKFNSLYGTEHKKRNGKFVRHCRGIGGIRAWRKTGNEKKES